METRVLTAHVPVELAARVDAYAASLDRSRGWIVKQALTAWIDREEEKLRLTLEGLADVEAGRVIEHDEVRAWVKSLSTNSPLPPPVPR